MVKLTRNRRLNGAASLAARVASLQAASTGQ
jgi:hypothetical protein